MTRDRNTERIRVYGKSADIVRELAATDGITPSQLVGRLLYNEKKRRIPPPPPGPRIPLPPKVEVS